MYGLGRVVTAEPAARSRRVGRRLAETVLDSLVRQIVTGAYQEGDMLPPEPMLCEEFGVSRTTIREAAKILDSMGLVRIVQGRGSTVMPQATWNGLDPMIIAVQVEHDETGQVFEELNLVRLALESEMAAQAAIHLTLEFEQQMRAVQAQSAENFSNPDRHSELDFEFHRLITEASGNRFARGIMASYAGPLHASRRITDRAPDSIERGQAIHDEILAAIVDRDPSLARQKMHDHLTGLWEEIQTTKSMRRPAIRPESG